ncbi:MAG TPA: hypothetical protein VND64_24355, partial [Pirellulales bacterium]|nr:hypothetical protein [Pirellulales bacterium]
MSQKRLFEEAETIISVLHSGERQDLLILIIPSHDKGKRLLNNQEQWANAALGLFADLFGGATAFKTFKGIYKTDDGEILEDIPILIECYAKRTDVEDRDKLVELLRFAKRMGNE